MMYVYTSAKSKTIKRTVPCVYIFLFFSFFFFFKKKKIGYIILWRLASWTGLGWTGLGPGPGLGSGPCLGPLAWTARHATHSVYRRGPANAENKPKGAKSNKLNPSFGRIYLIGEMDDLYSQMPRMPYQGRIKNREGNGG